ncbi:uncharacterized protein ASCRUDRAFT_82700 [Ascoidea rubescens DSM 1968]|uniref:Uncharacterized protein n=1 Tax=Ascoidea rubescens DSM 1968 TaxID=1344418 RepID=A0A1D2VA48_9ASCO|nr:hypothetical protein ASCRUDRAFT_82700 [Ascoidea rubescens DSM 1968]ODV58542.1 hypothetical protein ASCRUDRAFT_82700 [Ascoidea rubescens DSM 1968]
MIEINLNYLEMIYYIQDLDKINLKINNSIAFQNPKSSSSSPFPSQYPDNITNYFNTDFPIISLNKSYSSNHSIISLSLIDPQNLKLKDIFFDKLINFKNYKNIARKKIAQSNLIISPLTSQSLKNNRNNNNNTHENTSFSNVTTENTSFQPLETFLTNDTTNDDSQSSKLKQNDKSVKDVLENLCNQKIPDFNKSKTNAPKPVVAEAQIIEQNTVESNISKRIKARPKRKVKTTTKQKHEFKNLETFQELKTQNNNKNNKTKNIKKTTKKIADNNHKKSMVQQKDNGDICITTNDTNEKQKQKQSENLIEIVDKTDFNFNVDKLKPLKKYSSRKKVLKSIAKLHNKVYVTESIKKKINNNKDIWDLSSTSSDNEKNGTDKIENNLNLNNIYINQKSLKENQKKRTNSDAGFETAEEPNSSSTQLQNNKILKQKNSISSQKSQKENEPEEQISLTSDDLDLSIGNKRINSTATAEDNSYYPSSPLISAKIRANQRKESMLNINKNHDEASDEEINISTKKRNKMRYLIPDSEVESLPKEIRQEPQNFIDKPVDSFENNKFIKLDQSNIQQELTRKNPPRKGRARRSVIQQQILSSVSAQYTQSHRNLPRIEEETTPTRIIKEMEQNQDECNEKVNIGSGLLEQSNFQTSAQIGDEIEENIIQEKLYQSLTSISACLVNRMKNVEQAITFKANEIKNEVEQKIEEMQKFSDEKMKEYLHFVKSLNENISSSDAELNKLLKG